MRVWGEAAQAHGPEMEYGHDRCKLEHRGGGSGLNASGRGNLLC